MGPFQCKLIKVQNLDTSKGVNTCAKLYALLQKFQRIAFKMNCVAIKAAPGPVKGSIYQSSLMSVSLYMNE